MRARARNPFLTVRTEGSILPADLLARIAAGDKDLEGLSPESYHLAKNERVHEVATRAWNRLQGAWEAFREAAERLSETDLGTSLTRERWLLILFQELGYGRLMTHRAWELDGRTYPISHLWGQTPIHLVGCRVRLDTKQAGVAGAARVSPHGLVQEFLNRSDDHLWGIVSNGLTLRILRNNVSLTRQAYVEFDLEAMMESEAFSDFVLLFLVCHQSRVEVPEEKTPESCWLEKWHTAAAEQGIRALETLRVGVEQAITALGAGFLAHPANAWLRATLKDGVLSTQDYYRQLLRMVYRLLFLFVAEDRDLLYDLAAPLENRALYAKYYTTRRIRELAQARRGTKHADLYRGLRLVFEKLRAGCVELALPALDGLLFSGGSTPDLDSADIANRDLLAAFRHLACTIDGDVLRPIDYRNLGPEELGSVYESLLEMHPQVNADAATFELEVAAGSERKTTGSFYTHSSLVQCLLDSALDPVLDEAIKKPDPEAGLLNLKICDPASGSGHFLIAAAHRVAKRLAAVRTGEDEPSPEATRSALRDVIGRCLYGVDINPMAVELCKISLWMEAMEPGKTLGFLDHHIRCGNSLLGTTPALLAKGIPDDAFTPIEGDDKTVCKDLKAQNKKERAGQMALGEMLERRAGRDLAMSFAELSCEDDASLASRERKAEHYRSLVESADYERARFLADAWCAAFVLPKTSLDDLAVTHRRFRMWEANPEKVREENRQAIRQVAEEYQFFHWHLAFPEVFRSPKDGEEAENEQCGWSGGFDCVLGNPPWDKMTLVEQEFFAAIPEIASEQRSNRRKQLIDDLQESDPALYASWEHTHRTNKAAQALVVLSGYFPLSAVGELNLFALFAEISITLSSASGQIGTIVKSSLLLSPTWAAFTAALLESSSLRRAYDFRNWRGWFPSIGYHERFTLLHVSKRPAEDLPVELGFYFDEPADAKTSKLFLLSPKDLLAFNPITRTLPVFDSQESKELLSLLYERFGILSSEHAGWKLAYSTGFHMTSSSSLLTSKEEVLGSSPSGHGECTRHLETTEFMPLLEGKLLHQYDPRFASFSGIPAEERFGRKAPTTNPNATAKLDPFFQTEPRYWIPRSDAEADLDRRGVSRTWGFAFRDTTNVISNFRTAVGCISGGWCYNYKAPNLVPYGPSETGSADALEFCALFNSFPFDYVVRQKFFGANLIKSILDQVACPAKSDVGFLRAFMRARSIELSYTAWALSPFAEDVGWCEPPFRWDEERRFLIRCEIDAAFFHLYLGTPQEWREKGSAQLLEYFPTPRDAVDYIMETFPIVKRKDEERYGEYRAKLQILDIYDRMQHAIDAGEPYRTLLDPPPGPPADEHGNFLPLPEWKPGHPKPPNWPPHIHPPKEVSLAEE